MCLALSKSPGLPVRLALCPLHFATLGLSESFLPADVSATLEDHLYILWALPSWWQLAKQTPLFITSYFSSHGQWWEWWTWYPCPIKTVEPVCKGAVCIELLAQVLSACADITWTWCLVAATLACSAWCILYKLPITKGTGDLQWQLLHGFLAMCTFVCHLDLVVPAACPFCKEGVGDTLFQSFLDCLQLQPLFASLSTLFDTLDSQHPLWCTGPLQDSVHCLCPVPSNWGEHDLPGPFPGLLSQDADFENLQKLAHRCQRLQHLPTLLLLGSGSCHIWMWILHLAAKCGLVCITLDHKGSILQCGRWTASSKSVNPQRILWVSGVQSRFQLDFVANKCFMLSSWVGFTVFELLHLVFNIFITKF